MTKPQADEYLEKLENKLLSESEELVIELTRTWANSFPDESAVYLFREEGKICYVGETGCLSGRMKDILNTKNHTLRRNLGHSHFSELPNFEKATSKKSFENEIELLLNDRIQKHLTLSYITVNLGRKELEEKLFDKFKPKYNLKGKRKTYTKAEKQLKNKSAYEKWTTDNDEKLEKLFCEGKTTKELSEIFGRNHGAIRSRIRKLELRKK